MSFLKFLKEKIVLIFLLFFSLITIEIFFMMYPFDIFIKIYVPLVIFISFLLGLLYEYYLKKKYYDNFYDVLNKLNEKYLITEIIGKSGFVEGDILNDILMQVDKAMHENVNKYKYLQNDYKDYIELWIHEIKIPIATGKMIIENNKNNVTKSIDEEFDVIENYIEQALFYARSNMVDKDYYIRKCNLNDIVNESVKKNKTSLIQEKILINTHDLGNVVNTDSKWIVFILNQIIQNSIKYRNRNVLSNIEIYSEVGKDKIVLCIKDNGIGVKDEEVLRVFEKGFTGSNGRLSGKKSTGIGLYLCKKLCDKLGIAIEFSSLLGEGCLVKIVFPNSSYVNLI